MGIWHENGVKKNNYFYKNLKGHGSGIFTRKLQQNRQAGNQARQRFAGGKCGVWQRPSVENVTVENTE